MVLKFGVFVFAVIIDHAFGNCGCGNPGINRTLTLTNGQPVDLRTSTYSLNSNLIRQSYFLDTISGFVREKIPERVIHAKGAGAFGYFELTESINNICKAKLFSNVGKRTKVVARFSHPTLDKGGPDVQRGARGFAVKFYSEEGNLDLVTFNTPMFNLKEPLMFEQIIRASRRDPVSNFLNATSLWDLITLRPEMAFFFLYTVGDNGIPASYKYMPGYSIHTYQLDNERGVPHFVRFYIMPDEGIKNLINDDEIKNADPDYLEKDLFYRIKRGECLTWTLCVQILTLDDVKNAELNVFDITKVLPPKYPMKCIGKLVLDENPTNYFNDVEQVAFSPGNLIPGVRGGVDKLFESRILAYRVANDFRLGSNAHNIRVNCPLSPVFSINRDGVPPTCYNGGNTPNYFPDSYGIPMPLFYENKAEMYEVVESEDQFNFKQANQFFEGLCEDERKRLVKNIVTSLADVDDGMKKRAIILFKAIHSELGKMISSSLNKQK